MGTGHEELRKHQVFQKQQFNHRVEETVLTRDWFCDERPCFRLGGGQCHGVSFGRFWKYNNFHLRISLWKLLRPPVARYGEAAIVRPRATCLQWTLH